MSTARHVTQRLSPTALKKATGTSHRSSVSKPLSGPKPSPKLGKAKAAVEREVEAKEEEEEEEDDMATSFLQYCAMCEKQIVVPNNSILYCSENCRRKDGNKRAPTYPFPSLLAFNNATTTTAPTPPSPDYDSPDSVTARTIVPRRKPTVLPTSGSKPPLQHNAKSDLDPTEWKPDLPHRPSSEAFDYLSQFHRDVTALKTSRRPAVPTDSSSPMMVARTVMTPSLSHTPTTSAPSSLGSVTGTPYEFVPSVGLPKGLQAPSDGKVPKADKLSKPTTTALTLAKPDTPAVPVIVYKKRTVSNADPVEGSLKKLLGMHHEGITVEM